MRYEERVHCHSSEHNSYGSNTEACIDPFTLSLNSDTNLLYGLMNDNTCTCPGRRAGSTKKAKDRQVGGTDRWKLGGRSDEQTGGTCRWLLDGWTGIGWTLYSIYRQIISCVSIEIKKC